MVDRLAQHVEVAIVVDDIAWSPGMHRAWQALEIVLSGVSVSHGRKRFLIKAPHMARQQHALA